MAILVMLVSLSACKVRSDIQQHPPNVLIIFPDQLRRYSAGYWQDDPYEKYVIGLPDPVVTPAIDQLAKNGVVFTNAISNFPLCSPYRGMLLTGQYPEQNGIWGNCKAGRTHELSDDVKTITDLFFEAGYNTAYFGKCHWEKTEPLFDENGGYKGTTNAPGGYLVNDFDTYVPPGPARHHIEYFYQALKDSHFDPMIYSNDPNVIDGKSDGELHRVNTFSALNESNLIVKYLRNTHKQRNEEKPFCMLWALNPPHNPWDDANTDMEMLNAYYDTSKYLNIEELVVRENADLEVAHYARNYFANVSSVDKYIGIVLEELEVLGMLENTIVVFTSDHGEMMGSHGKTGKNVLETEAIAIPFIVHYPDHIEAGIQTKLIGATDVLPTVLGLAGLSHKISTNMQGIDLSGAIMNHANAAEDNQALLLMLNNQRGIYTKEYTFVLSEDRSNGSNPDIYLYDNINDPYQKNRLSKEVKSEVRGEMLTTLGKKLKEANDPWYIHRKYSNLIVYPD